MLYEEIYKANIDALKNHDKIKRGILTIVYGKFKNALIELKLERNNLPDAECVKILQKTLKELDEEQLGYEKAGRTESVELLKAQKAVIEAYLPKMLSENEILEIINSLDDKSVPSVMKYFKTNYAGKCDMGLVNKLLRSL